MKIRMEITKATRYSWIKLIGKIRARAHMKRLPMPRVEIRKENGRKTGTIEY